MLYLWFKSNNGDKLEDSGIIEAKNTCEAQDILYEEYGYDSNSVCLIFESLDEVVYQIQNFSKKSYSMNDRWNA